MANSKFTKKSSGFLRNILKVSEIIKEMCGIAGLIQNSSKDFRDLIARMERSLAHRGPDDYGSILFDKETIGSQKNSVSSPYILAMIHRRLSILDLSESGSQPMSTIHGRYHIVFNGEIYNYIELRAELEQYGYHFQSCSDTEVLLAAYCHWGIGAISRFVGMFAFAIFDTCTRKLFLARDFFGVKPLYYTQWSEGFAFASEIKTLLNLPWIRRKVNAQRLFEYLRFGQTDHGNKTLFLEIEQIPSAHYLVLKVDDPSNIAINPYWSINTIAEDNMSFKDAAGSLRELFLDSIRLHLRSDVPLGTALSGGLDSSAIVNTIRYLEPQIDINAFSFIPSDDKLSEEKWISIAAQAAKAKVHKISISPEDLVADLDKIIFVQDEPFASTSIYAQFRVFQMASEHGVKVMLDGQGADELLAGYSPYLAARFASLVRSGNWKAAANFALHVSRQPGRGSGLFHAAQFLFPPKFQNFFRRIIGKDLMPCWLNRSWFESHDASMVPVNHNTGEEILISELKGSIKGVLPQLLRYEDRNSMAHSIESRVPFLTPALANFILSLPENYLISANGVSKAVFRAAMKGIVPSEILARKDKVGFATSEAHWLSQLTPWVQQLIKGDVAHSIPALNISLISSAMEKTLQVKKSFGFHIWRWINLIRWVEIFNVQF